MAIYLNPSKFFYFEMEYQATFGIDCGRIDRISSFDSRVKYPDYVREDAPIFADNPQVAYENAMTLARKFADKYLSNPNTGLTTVQLLSLRGPDGAVSFDASKSVMKKSWLEHIIDIVEWEFMFNFGELR